MQKTECKEAEGMCLEVPVEKLEKGKVTVVAISESWSLRVRVDESNYLGIYLVNLSHSKNVGDGLNLNAGRRGRDFFSFHTAAYNFQLESSPPVYETCGIFGFPRGWNYIYGPSKIARVGALKRSLKSKALRIRCWVQEEIRHSALLHHIALNMQQLVECASASELILIPAKDLYSLLESEVFNVKSEDAVLELLGKYMLYHDGDNASDILKSIRVNKASTESLLEALKNSVLNRSVQFVTRVIAELEFRSNLSYTPLERLWEQSVSSTRVSLASMSNDGEGIHSQSTEGVAFSQSSMRSVQSRSTSYSRSRTLDMRVIAPAQFAEGVLSFLLANDISHYLNPVLLAVSWGSL